MDTVNFLHELFHRVAGIEYPGGHWWIDLAAASMFVLAPAWLILIVVRPALRWALARPGNPSCSRIPAAPEVRALGPAPDASVPTPRWRLERFVLRFSLRSQMQLLALSVLTLPSAWLMLEIPKHIINHALSDLGGHGVPGMGLLGMDLGRTGLLLALCAAYLGVFTVNGLVKYGASRLRGRVNERLVRRLRLSVVRRARTEPSAERRATLAAVAVQEVEAVGYFGGGLVSVPLVQGGVLVTSVAFLLVQNAALAAAALVMLPVQITVLPRLQRRLNAKVRLRVHATRTLGALLAAPERKPSSDGGGRIPGVGADPTPLARPMRQVGELERMRVEINDLKGMLKGSYNYTSNLTPFFLFLVGGYLVVQGKLSLGALVAALTAYKEIAPALRELFDFAQAWSDATARFEEISKAVGLTDVAEAASRAGSAGADVGHGVDQHRAVLSPGQIA